MTDNCRWIIEVARAGEHNGVYCEAKVRYRMVLEEDGKRYRHNEPFCPTHTELAAAQSEDDWAD